MSRMSFSRSPYFDDFSVNKNYMRILFKPGFPVQARELNQIQSTFQNQLERFANHIFQNGTRVSNARASLNTKSYVRLQPNSLFRTNSEHPTGYPVDLSNFNTTIMLYGKTSGVGARFIMGVNAENGDPPTLYVVYTQTAIDATTVAFIPGEVIDFVDANGITIYSALVKCPGCVGSGDLDTISPTGSGKIFTIDEGVFYYFGLFAENANQSIIVSKYGEVVSCKLGFDFVQTIITSENDSSLLDNSLGYTNITAPGADRFKTELRLVKRTLNADDGDNFILLATIDNDNFQYLKADSEYGEIMNMIAKRTYETNGDYTVEHNAFKLKFIQDRATSGLDPNGYSVNGDDNYVRAVIGPGTAYIQGYRYSSSADQFLLIPKARDTKQYASFIKRIEDRSYILLRPLTSFSIYPNDPTTITSLDNSVVWVYDGNFDGSNQPTGSQIGSFKVYDVLRESGTYNATAPTPPAADTRAVCRYYIYDLNMGLGKKLSDGKSFVDSTGLHNFKAVPAADGVQLYNPNKMELIWKLDRDNIKTLRRISSDPSPTGSIDITVRKKFSGTLNSSGTITFNSVTNEYFLPFNPSTTVAVVSGSALGTGIVYTVDLSTNNRITVSTTSLAINLGTSPINVGGATTFTPPGLTVTLVTDVLKGGSIEDKKQISEKTISSISPTTNPIALGITDAFEIEFVKEYDSGSETDITSSFTLDTGVRDSTYIESKVIPSSSISLPVGKHWRIRIKYFTHNSYNAGYFDIDSYKDLIADGDMNYEDGPVYTTTNNVMYPLLSSLDFRPSVISTTVSGGSVPTIGSTVIFDVEYYLGRADLLQISKDGKIYAKHGDSSDSPSLPKDDENALVLYEIFLKPYVYSLADITFSKRDNKRYTMRDIGKLEQRISNVEYYAALSLLEKSAADMSVKDVNGLDRFKNGLVADNFKDYQAADLQNPEFRMGFDRINGEMRPSFYTTNKRLILKLTDSDAKFKGKQALIDYDATKIEEQPYATKSISVNPYFQYKTKGDLVLSPNNDTWSDTTTLPKLTVSIDTGVAALKTIADSIPEIIPSNDPPTVSVNTSVQESQRIMPIAPALGWYAPSKAYYGWAPSYGYNYNWWNYYDYYGWNYSGYPYYNNNWYYNSWYGGNYWNWYDNGNWPWYYGYNYNWYDNYYNWNWYGNNWWNGYYPNYYNLEWGNWSYLNNTIWGNWGYGAWGGYIPYRSPGIGLMAPISGQTTATTSTTVTQAATQKVVRTVGSRTDSYDIGTRVTDVSIQAYMRECEITFVATKMKPNTKLYAFFDDKPISQYCTPLYGSKGSQLLTDAAGQLYGTFNSPGATFFNGEKTFYLTNDKNRTGDPDIETCTASATFFSGGLNVTNQETTLNVTTPTATTTTTPVPAQTSTTTTQNTTQNQITGPQWGHWIGGSWYSSAPYTTTYSGAPNASTPWANSAYLCSYDPVAQSFSYVRDYFLTGVDVFFQDLDTDTGEQEIFVQIRPMVNGYPDSNINNALCTKRYLTSQLTQSEDSTVPFHVDWDYPIYVKGGTEYALVVGGWSPKTTLWVSKLGEEIINQPGQIVQTQPSLGSSFRSQNGSTWNAEQTEDVKYTMYAAKFKKRTMNLSFSPEMVITQLIPHPLESEASKTDIRVRVPQHGFSVNDNFKLNFFEDVWFAINVSSGQIHIGQTITSGDFSAMISDFRTNGVRTEIKMRNATGTFSSGNNWTCNQLDWSVRDNYLLTQMGYNSSLISNEGVVRYNQVTGTFVDNYIRTLNGIPIEELNKINIIKAVDSSNTFVFDATTPATGTGFFGGQGVSIGMNEKFEVFNISCSYLPYGSQESWVFNGIGYNPPGGSLPSIDYLALEPKTFTIAQDTHLEYTNRIVCAENVGAGEKVITITAEFTAPDEWTTPVINLDTLSMVTISNKVEWLGPAIDPNASSRIIPECDPWMGTEPYKYVTRIIKLQNAATDLVVSFDVYKDIDSDFDVWIKVLDSHITEVGIDDLPWMRIVGYDKSYNSVDLLDRIEYTLALSKLQLEVYTDHTHFTVQTWDDLSIEFSAFRVKIVGKSKNSAKPCLFRSFRAIAVT